MEVEVEDEHSGNRLQRQSRRLSTDGQRDARLNSSRRAEPRLAAATFRRPTKVFEDGINLLHLNYLLAFDGVIASRGSIPLIDHGVIIGAIGVSGGTDSQDEVASEAGAGVINRLPARNE